MPRLAAIVFDLDDTLVDTSAQLSGPAHREAAEAMIAAGLEQPVELVEGRRHNLARSHPGGELEALVLRSFGQEEGGAAARKVIAAGQRAFYERRVEQLEPFAGTLDVLESLAPGRKLLLVTSGAPRTQERKVELLGIRRWIDDFAFVPVGKPKLPAIERLLAAHDLSPPAVLVVGDRVDKEIAAGRRLGTWTVRVMHGEGRHLLVSGSLQQPHYSIDRIEGLLPVVADIEEGDERP